MKSKKYFRTASDFFSPIDEKQNPKSISLVLIGRLSQQQQQPSKKETESRPKGSRHFYRQVALLAGAGVFFHLLPRKPEVGFFVTFSDSPNRIVFLFLPSNFKAGPFP